MLEALQFAFMRHALAAGLLASIACCLIGSLVVINRLVFLAGGIAHAAYGGIGLALFLGLPFALGTTGFAVVAALVMAAVTLKAKHRADAIIGVVWAAGMALGVILVDLTPGYRVDLMGFLFGSIMAVPTTDLWLMLGVDFLLLAVIWYRYHDLVALSFDEDFARIRGVPVTGLYVLLLVLIAVVVVTIVRVVGLILVIALLTIGPYIAERHVKSLMQMMLLSFGLNCLFTAAGLWLAYSLDLTSGATIILVAATCFFLALAIDAFWRRHRSFH